MPRQLVFKLLLYQFIPPPDRPQNEKKIGLKAVETAFATAIVASQSNQRTNGPVNAFLVYKAQNIQKLENIWYRNDLDLQYLHTFINSISCLHLPTFRSLAVIVSEKSTVFTFSHRKT